jgi:hypothetical protein
LFEPQEGYISQPLAQALHHRADRDHAARRRYLVASAERGLQTSERQRVAPAPRRAGCLHDLLRSEIVEEEDVVIATFLEIRLAQEAPRVFAHQEGQVGLLADVVLVDGPAFEDLSRDAQRQRGVGTLARIHPQGGVNHARRVVGCHGDERGAAITRFHGEVNVGNACRYGIAAPEDQRVGAHPVVGASVHEGGAPRLEGSHGEVAGPSEAVENRGSEHGEEPHLRCRAGARVDVRRSIVVYDGLAATLLDRVQDGIGQSRERLLPGDATPAARAARAHPLERMDDAVGARHQVAVARALLATARREVGEARHLARVGVALFLAPDHAVFDEQVPRTRAEAVRAQVGSAHHGVPVPGVAVDVAVIHVGGRLGKAGRGGLRVRNARCQRPQ